MHNISRYFYYIIIILLFYRITHDPFCAIKIKITKLDRLGFMFV